MYRVLTALLSWKRISSMGTAVFGRMHRGMESSVEIVGDRGLRWVLESPPHLVPPLIGRCYGTALAAALEAGGLRGSRVTVEEQSPTRLQLSVLRPL